MNTIEELKNICDHLKSISSKIEKQQFLYDNINNELFRELLFFLLNPFVITGISERKINKNVGILPDMNYSELLTYNTTECHIESNDIRALFRYIDKHNTGRDIDISVCENYFTNFDWDIQEFIKSIITKSLKLGVDAKSVNKVFGEGFIPVFNCQLAEKYFNFTNKVENKSFSLTTKIDGQRCLIVKDHGAVSLFSRQGILIKGLVDIEDEINNHPMDNFVLDGELTLLNATGLSSGDQYKQTIKITRKNGEKHGIKFLAFDWLTLEDFKHQKCNTKYALRREYLDKYYIKMTYINILPVLYSGKDISKIKYWLDIERKRDQEGIMINLNDSVYEFKRTTNLLKCKIMQDADLLVTNIYEGTGRNIRKLGGIEIEFINKGNHYRCNCGSGFSDKERDLYFNHQNLLIGKIVTIQYFEISEDKNNNYGLRFPIWISRIRDDKTEISMN